jgi:hypothetical protein
VRWASCCGEAAGRGGDLLVAGALDPEYEREAPPDVEPTLSVWNLVPDGGLVVERCTVPY